MNKLIDAPTKEAKLQAIMDYVTSCPSDDGSPVRLSGHNLAKIIANHEQNGIPVNDAVWAKIKSL